MNSKRVRLSPVSDIPKDMRMCLEFLENNSRLPESVKEKMNEIVAESKAILKEHFKNKEVNMEEHVKSFVYLQINFFFALLHNILQILYKDELMRVVQRKEGEENKLYIIMYQLFNLVNIDVKVQRINKEAVKKLVRVGYSVDRLPKVDPVDERILVYFSCRAIVPPELNCYIKLETIDAVAVNKHFRLETLEKLFPDKHDALLSTDDEVDFPECEEFFKRNVESIQTTFNKIVLNLIYERRNEECFWGAAGVLNPNFWTGIRGDNRPVHPLMMDNTSILDSFLTRSPVNLKSKKSTSQTTLQSATPTTSSTTSISKKSRKEPTRTKRKARNYRNETHRTTDKSTQPGEDESQDLKLKPNLNSKSNSTLKLNSDPNYNFNSNGCAVVESANSTSNGSKCESVFQEPFSIDNAYFEDHGDVTSLDVLDDIKNLLFVNNVLPENDTYLFITPKGWMHFTPTSDLGTPKTFRFFTKFTNGKEVQIKKKNIVDCIKLNVIQGVETKDNHVIYTHNNRHFFIPSGENNFVPTVTLRYVPPLNPEIYLFSTRLILLRRQCFQNGIDVDHPQFVYSDAEKKKQSDPNQTLQLKTKGQEQSIKGNEQSIKGNEQDTEEQCAICFFTVKKCLSTKWICLFCKDKHIHQLCSVKLRSRNTVYVPCPFCRVEIPSLKTEHVSVHLD